MDLQVYRQQMLAHCLWMAELDPAYAEWAAGWYEANEPEVLKNLGAKVAQEVARRCRAPTSPVR